MKPLADGPALGIKLSKSFKNHAPRLVLMALFLGIAWGASAQTVTWSESYTKDFAPDGIQQTKWANFLSEIKDKKFASVKIWGSLDPTGIELTDPAAASELARLLSYELPGTVTSNGHTWTVTSCDIGTGVLRGALSVDGNQAMCDCKDKYALRPFSTNEDWGGLKASVESCNSESQTINLEFRSAVTVIAGGPTTICNGQSVELSVKSELCGGALEYKWSNDETTPAIKATKAGTYWVSVYDPVTKCGGTSDPITITSADISLAVSIEGTDKFCTEPVQLNAKGTSLGGLPSGTPHNFCFSDESGPVACALETPTVCDQDAFVLDESNSYSTVSSIENPTELQYKLYYYKYVAASFVFRVNGKEVGRHEDPSTNMNCAETPVIATIGQDKLRDVWSTGENVISVEVLGSNGVHVVALSVDVITSNDTYSWTPATGLDRADIPNPKASPETSELYTVTYTDANGCRAYESIAVKVGCGETPEPPTLTCVAPFEVFLETGCTVSRIATDFIQEATSPGGLLLTYSIEPAGPFAVGTTPVTITVTDSEGQQATCTTSITLVDAIAPIIQSPSAITLQNEHGTCTATHVLTLPVVSDNCVGITTTHDYVDEFNNPKTTFEVGETTVTWTATDASGNVSTAIQKVTVTNTAPVVTSVSASLSSVPVNTTVILGVVFDDNNAASAVIDWGDGSARQELLTPETIFEATHLYSSAGEFTVTVTITDVCGAAVSEVYGPIVVYDRRAGSVNGGGWFESPPGAYKKDERATGRGSFSFDAKYTSYSNTPVGTASFTFKPGNLKFKSTSFDLLLVNGEAARLTGEGTVNGKPGYKLLITMVDDDTKGEKDRNTKKVLKNDRIRVKISDSNGVVIYDNQVGEPDEAIASTRISSGSIEIETTTFQTMEEDATVAASSFGEEATSVYPNPFTDYLNVEYNTGSNESLVVQLMDLAGRVIASGVFPVSEGGSYSLDVPENAEEGIYILKIKQGKKVELLNVVRK